MPKFTMQAPIRTSIQTVLPDWCDYNGHMNVAYYTLAFENAAFEAQEVIDMGERYVHEDKKSLFTSNAIESLNSQIRKAIKNRRIFPNDNSAMKVIYLAIESASKKWTMPIRNWKNALNRFAIEFVNRMPNL